MSSSTYDRNNHTLTDIFSLEEEDLTIGSGAGVGLEKIGLVRYIVDDELVARKISIKNSSKLNEFIETIRNRFEISPNTKTELYYIDDENDFVIVSFEDEFSLALKSSASPKFELINKSNSLDKISQRLTTIKNQSTLFKEAKRNIKELEVEVKKILSNTKEAKKNERPIKARIIYPESLRRGGTVDTYYEVVFKSSFLTLKCVHSSSLNPIYGTGIYTDDSDLLKALIHSKPIKLSEDPPPYNILATIKILGTQSHYIGSYSNGLHSRDYGVWSNSFQIEDYVCSSPEKDTIYTSKNFVQQA
ncbi:hypothetical protein Glove_535g45 [Diversispora epigaea]|uniref:PB1 domain-containing protein n=1 Tax=Diversispora epigaea TaxID=1348612 RepID=A0A397GGS2_9GLOM|nr:hypothetical protein Glove_535g45 [Diversispora epigaea]